MASASTTSQLDTSGSIGQSSKAATENESTADMQPTNDDGSGACKSTDCYVHTSFCMTIINHLFCVILMDL